MSSFFPYLADKNFSLAPFPLSPAGRCSATTHHQSARGNNASCRSSFETSAHISMERRTRAVDWKQPKPFRHLRRRDRQAVAARNKSIQRQSEFRIHCVYRQLGNIRLQRSCRSSFSADCRAVCKRWARTHGPIQSISLRQMRSPQTSTRRAKSPMPTCDRGNSNFDVRHAFTAGVTYELPLSITQNCQSDTEWLVVGQFYLRQIGATRERRRRKFLRGRNTTRAAAKHQLGRSARNPWLAISRRQDFQSRCF